MPIPIPMPNEACFIHIKKGGINAISAKDVLPIDEEQSVLMKCGHYVSQLLPNKETGIYEAFAVHFYPDVMRKIYEDGLPEFLKPGKVMKGAGFAAIEVSYLINRYVEDLQYYLDHPHLVNEAISIHKLKEIILLLVQTEDASKISDILKNLFTQRTVEFKEVIEAHLFSDLSFSEFAQLLNMSLATFKRQFNAIYNCPPARYIQLKRLEKARELLELSEDPITTIAFECGYKTVGHFSRKFKEVYGITPSQIRLNRSGN